MNNNNRNRIVELNRFFYRLFYPGEPFCQHFVTQIRSKLSRHFLSQPGDCILDIACGKKQPFVDYPPAAYVVGADISIDNLRNNRHCKARICCDFNYLPFRTGSLDWVVSVDTVEHIENPAPGFLELSRVTKSVGKVVIATPNLLNPKGLLIKFIPLKAGNIVWRILREGQRLPYPHHYNANTPERIHQLLGKTRFTCDHTEYLEEDPLWFYKLPLFPIFIAYSCLMNSLPYMARLRSYFFAVYSRQGHG